MYARTEDKNGKPRFTKEQEEEFEQYSKMLMDWMDRNTHPHCTCIVTVRDCELVDGVMAVSNKKYANPNNKNAV